MQVVITGAFLKYTIWRFSERFIRFGTRFVDSLQTFFVWKWPSIEDIQVSYEQKKERHP